MEKGREFLISPERLIGLSMDLATLLHSHESMCRWLGPYEQEANEKDYIADCYKHYFEERISYLLLTLSLLLRTLDDRGLIDRYTKHEEPIQTGLGLIRIRDRWEEINNLRTVLNFIIHAREVIPNPSSKKIEFQFIDPVAFREVRWLAGSILILGEHPKGSLTTMQLHLQPYCDMVFRVMESIKG